MRDGRSTRQRRGGGFTMVEMVITIALVMLMLGIALVSMGALSTERRLREVTATVKDYAKKARRQAIVEQRAFQIRFFSDAVSVGGLRRLSDEDRAVSRFIDTVPEEGRIEELTRSGIPDEIRLLVRGWNEEEWRPAAGQTWVFERSGICEPLFVRVEEEEGSYIEMAFNPLTAGVEEEASEIR